MTGKRIITGVGPRTRRAVEKSERQTSPAQDREAPLAAGHRYPLRVILAEDVPACGRFVCLVTEPQTSTDVWVVTFSGTPQGSVTLTFDAGDGPQTTAPITLPTTAAAITSAIEALGAVPAGSVEATRFPGRWLIEFNGALPGTITAASVGTDELLGGDAEIEADCDWVDTGRTVKARCVMPGAHGVVFAGWIGVLQHFARFGWGLTGAECRTFTEYA